MYMETNNVPDLTLPKTVAMSSTFNKRQD